MVRKLNFCSYFHLQFNFCILNCLWFLPDILTPYESHLLVKLIILCYYLKTFYYCLYTSAMIHFILNVNLTVICVCSCWRSGIGCQCAWRCTNPVCSTPLRSTAPPSPPSTRYALAHILPRHHQNNSNIAIKIPLKYIDFEYLLALFCFTNYVLL